MTVVNAAIGAVTPTSAICNVVGTVNGTASVQITTTDFDDPGVLTFGPVTTANLAAMVPVTGLTPNTTYQWRAVHDGTPSTAWTGRFRTHPPLNEPANFNFAVSSCAGATPESPGVGAVLLSNRLSNSPVFQTIAQHGSDPLFFAHTGDRSYYNFGNPGDAGTDAAAFRRQYNDLMLQPNQAALTLAMPWMYAWDDHDFGPNNSDASSPSREAAGLVYRERVPAYALAEDVGCYQTWVVGRVRFILSDCRSGKSPGSGTDGPEKTMLGIAQREWTLNLLATATEAALVWLMPIPWGKPGSDGWGAYATERQMIIDAIADHGWSERMIMISGDGHAHGICRGPNNPLGGFPHYMISGLDSTPGDFGSDAFPDGYLPNRRLYGIVRVTDDGTTISMRTDFYVDTLLWQSVLDQFGGSDPGPGPNPEPPPALEVVRSKVVRWHVADLVSGQILRELPAVMGEVSVALGQYTTGALQVPVVLSGPGFVENLEELLIPNITLILLEMNDRIAWGGLINGINYSGEALEISWATLENYFNYRFVPTREFNNYPIGALMTTLVANTTADHGVNINSRQVSPTTLRTTVAYDDADDITVYKALTDLMAIENAPEFTVEYEWVNAEHKAIRKWFSYGGRIGMDRPNVTLRTKGREAVRYKYSRLFSDGYSATAVRVSGPGEGDSRPTGYTDAGDLIEGGWPLYERRIKDDVNTDLGVLLGKAQGELNRLRNGTTVVSLEARIDVVTWGADWTLGDTVGYELYSNLHPSGISGRGRIIGYKIDPVTEKITPTVVEDVSYGYSGPALRSR